MPTGWSTVCMWGAAAGAAVLITNQARAARAAFAVYGRLVPFSGAGPARPNL